MCVAGRKGSRQAGRGGPDSLGEDPDRDLRKPVRQCASVHLRFIIIIPFHAFLSHTSIAYIADLVHHVSILHVHHPCP